MTLVCCPVKLLRSENSAQRRLHELRLVHKVQVDLAREGLSGFVHINIWTNNPSPKIEGMVPWHSSPSMGTPALFNILPLVQVPVVSVC